jgi:hypothetical protein
MKISRKLYLYIMHVIFLFIFFSFFLAVKIVDDLFNSNTQKIEITLSYLIRPIILGSLFWLFSTFSGALSKLINKNYED